MQGWQTRVLPRSTNKACVHFMCRAYFNSPGQTFQFLTFDNRAHESSASNDYAPLSRNRESSKPSTTIPPTVSEHSDRIGKSIGAFLPRKISSIAQQINLSSELHSKHCVFINTRLLVFSRKEEVVAVTNQCENEMMEKEKDFLLSNHLQNIVLVPKATWTFARSVSLNFVTSFLLQSQSIVLEDPTLSELYKYRFFGQTQETLAFTVF